MSKAAVTRPLTYPNAVRGCPDWFYGLRLRIEGPGEKPRVSFSVYRLDNHRSIDGIVASGYRTTRLARYMGERELPGYQHAAQLAIKNLEPKE